MSSLTTFGQWLRLRRKALDLTQEELAKRVQCSVSAIRKIEADERRPSRQIAGLLAENLEILPHDRIPFIRVARGEHSIDWLNYSQTPNNKVAMSRLNLSVSNMPVQPNPLVGREQEFQKINHVIESPQCRLLSLVGRGGIGKTHLAIEVALNQRKYFQDGVFFIPLSLISSTGYIYPSIAGSIGLSLFDAVDLSRQVLDYLADREMLLLMDNFEHLLPGSKVISDIIHYAPGVKILVTSMERLNLTGEWVFELQGLPVPPVDQLTGLESYNAIILFVQNAVRTDIRFNVKELDYSAIAKICRLVDGLPLGIELAAGWIRTLSCSEIASEIETNLDIYSMVGRDAPDRHLSLRAILDYSWGLLSTEEQNVLSKLSIFVNGFNRETAQQIAGAPLKVLAALADKSLIHRNQDGYYRLPELVRRHAFTHLDPKIHDFLLAKLKDITFNAIIAETIALERFSE
jgi:predicted ATPase/DNA-binding XRE family transcriptional regulator